ncbi:hypothetical protein [Risungbinella massiliensis]|uniref:hypothetical protein n=1 Tax=Risungbinella massiliensis TaxID=1329796 RepID=UPI0005CC4F64|nr:hypothetical protein [Risungbinella massiliensis]
MGPVWKKANEWNCAVCELRDDVLLKDREICPICNEEPIQPKIHDHEVKARCSKCTVTMKQTHHDKYSYPKDRVHTPKRKLKKTRKGPYIICSVNCPTCKTKYQSHFIL